ncbi:LicD family-domain-containing protein [Podospora fimiseda]|uniref:LicD family-domain-containing protein n=1 Tax=Podospora fimiseda TaxID=252190 RepID=A0AAN7BR69_9PEZI|nr:LicD family-domain-containing protein [Podospora fimiseda]
MNSSMLRLPRALPTLPFCLVLLISSLLLGVAAISRTSSSNPPRQENSPLGRSGYRPDFDEKYFHEAGNTLELSHYDGRYFRGEVPYEAHRDVLTQLIRSYLSVTASLGAETWLAHGTLLGWWWNGHIMPWDYDLDAQVSIATLDFMSQNFNGTFHEWKYVLDSEEDADNEAYGEGDVITKTYLLDVNPNYIEVDRGQGNNVIDARWIDVDTGMYVDITALVERDPNTMPGVWSCKNFHYYRTRDIWPLRDTTFEGVGAKIPFEFENILIAEYGHKSMVVTEWEGHRWYPDIKEWVKIGWNDTETEKVL